MQTCLQNLSFLYQESVQKGGSPNRRESTCNFQFYLWSDNNNIEVVSVTANITYLIQPLELTVNSYSKILSNRKFSEWFPLQIIKQFNDGKGLHDIDVPLKLSLLKPLHAQWLVLIERSKNTKGGTDVIYSA